MQNVFNKLMDSKIKNCKIFFYKEKIWFITSDNEFILSYYKKTKYVFYSFFYFNEVIQIFSIDRPKLCRLLTNWLQDRFKIEVGVNVHADVMPGSYDFRSDFKISEVYEKGEIKTDCKSLLE